MVVESVTRELLYMDDVTAAFGVKEKAIRRWIAELGLPAVKIGNVWRFDRVAVQAWDRERLAAAAAQREAV